MDPSLEEVIVFVSYGPYPSLVEVDCGCIASVALREEFGTPIVDWKSFTVVKAGM